MKKEQMAFFQRTQVCSQHSNDNERPPVPVVEMSFSDPFGHWMQVVHIYSGKILIQQYTKIGVFKKLEIYFIINKNNYIGWHFNFCTCILYQFYVLAKLYLSSPVQYLKKIFCMIEIVVHSNCYYSTWSCMLQISIFPFYHTVNMNLFMQHLKFPINKLPFYL